MILEQARGVPSAQKAQVVRRLRRWWRSEAEGLSLRLRLRAARQVACLTLTRRMGCPKEPA
ncbi:protein of unknown function [Nitrospira defluvii]|uniref:Uncharacterized protein n=1 Tax=Nitrospira defluvii TaxID=330214 RepID=B3U4M1_9BACT|nr:protein of unknown function [Nitrospira defluvii]CBK41181.1 protein of unknown function [Nitrospira defluvii]